MSHIFNLTLKPNKGELEASYEAAMLRLNDFFDLDWTRYLPPVFIVEDRATINYLRSQKTELWVVGWSDRRKVYLLARGKMGTEADREYSVDEYNALLAHELCHLFFNSCTNGGYNPTWLNEGLSGFLSGDSKFKKRPERFSSFLEFFDSGGAGVYNEAAFAVEALVTTYGKEKILELLQKMKEAGQNLTREQFDAFFKATYGFEPTYDVFNKIIVSENI